MYIKRHIEKTLREYNESFPVVLVTGSRQVGKSTMLKESFGDVEYVTLDDRVVHNALHQDPQGFLMVKGTPLIIDEIQREQASFVDIKYLVDKNRHPGMYILTGSQRYELMEKVSESLAGRIGVLNMLPLSVREAQGDSFDAPFIPTGEYLNRRKSTQAISVKDIWKMIHRGFMPELVVNRKMQWEAYYAAYVDTYIERDVRALTQVGDMLTFVRFMTALAARTGELLNMHDVAKDVGIDDKTVKRWISILEASGIIYMLKPFSLNVNKRVVKTQCH